jgi:malate dehydrogenase (oxaloacetate-decarboxylating)(NADP+)
VKLDGQTFVPGQANNFYIFPAVGMAIYATNPKRVTDEMFVAAAHALADQVTPEELAQGTLYPPQANILEVEIKIATRVAEVVFEQNLARISRPKDLEAFIRSLVYDASYSELA